MMQKTSYGAERVFNNEDNIIPAITTSHDSLSR